MLCSFRDEYFMHTNVIACRSARDSATIRFMGVGLLGTQKTISGNFEIVSSQ
jgi:hypothetical protein